MRVGSDRAGIFKGKIPKGGISRGGTGPPTRGGFGMGRGRSDSGISSRGGGGARGGSSFGSGRLMITPKVTFDFEARKTEILANRTKCRGRESEGTTKVIEGPENAVIDIDTAKVEDIVPRIQAPEVCQIKLENFSQKKRSIYLKDIERNIDRLEDIENYAEWATAVYKELQLNSCTSLIPESDEEVDECHDSYIRSILLNSVTIENFFFEPNLNRREILAKLKEESSKINSLEFLL